MKKFISLLVVMLLCLGVLGLSACGGSDDGNDQSDDGQTSQVDSSDDEGTQTTTSSNDDQSEPEDTQEEDDSNDSSSSSSGFSWSDMPIYPGADQIHELSMMLPITEEDEYTEVEQLYYESNDDLNKISDWYESKMPKEGWEEVGHFGAGEMTWAMYSKNNEDDFAMTMFAVNEDGGTVMVLMRAAR